MSLYRFVKSESGTCPAGPSANDFLPGYFSGALWAFFHAAGQSPSEEAFLHNLSWFRNIVALDSSGQRIHDTSEQAPKGDGERYGFVVWEILLVPPSNIPLHFLAEQTHKYGESDNPFVRLL